MSLDLIPIMQEASSAQFFADTAFSLRGWQMPLVLSLMAGLSTCIGAAVVFFAGNDGKNKIRDEHLAFSLSLAGSVMITVSVASILPECFHDTPIQSVAFWERCLSLAIGCGFYVLIAKCFPEPDDVLSLPFGGEASTLSSRQSHQKQLLSAKTHRQNAAEVHDNNNTSDGSSETRETLEMVNVTTKQPQWTIFLSGSDLGTIQSRREWRVAILLFVSLAVHNFPEGAVVAASSYHSQHLGLTTALAIALHNIPEGVSIAVPCLAARPDAPLLAFGLASLSGLAEPLGAAIALAFMHFSSSTSHSGEWSSMENILAFVAGIMTTVALVELFPAALQHAQTEKVPLVLGTASGAIIMLVSEAALQ